MYAQALREEARMGRTIAIALHDIEPATFTPLRTDP